MHAGRLQYPDTGMLKNYKMLIIEFNGEHSNIAKMTKHTHFNIF